MLALKVPKFRAEEARLQLTKLNLLDKYHRIILGEGYVEIPMLRTPEKNEMNVLAKLAGEVMELSTTIPRDCFFEPMKDIIQQLDLSEDKLAQIPKKWEMLGNVMIMKLDQNLVTHKSHIAETYAEVIGAKTVLLDVSGIDGEFREPDLELLWGTETETTHLENGVRYCLDAAKLMFSSGNIDERIRMATIAKPGEVIVDMFAGIGYFSLPVAIHSGPKRLQAYEINPIAYDYLEKNIELNEVNDIIEPHPVNCLEAEENIADRVIMGYVGTTHEFLPKAMRILKEEGIIHYHETCPNALLPGRPTERVMEAARTEGRKAEILNLKDIKSYAPGVSHVVLDVAVS